MGGVPNSSGGTHADGETWRALKPRADGSGEETATVRGGRVESDIRGMRG